jgi:8-oxo-dGTP pyrophosphatase MutT (NUDIX family)
LALIVGVAQINPIWERSAGVIPFLVEPTERRPWYLLIHSARVLNPQARWEFPKGTIESGESAREAAGREFIEETGLRSWRVLEGFQRTLNFEDEIVRGERRLFLVEFTAHSHGLRRYLTVRRRTPIIAKVVNSPR